MIEIFDGIINPIEETFIEVRNGLQNWMIAQKYKNAGKETDFEEDGEDGDYEDGGPHPASAIDWARIHADAQKRVDGIKGADRPETIAATVDGEKIEVGKKRLKKLYKETHPGIDKVSEEELARFLKKICVMEREDDMGK